MEHDKKSHVLSKIEKKDVMVEEAHKLKREEIDRKKKEDYDHRIL